MRNDNRHDTHGTTDARLARLGELDDFKVADGDPDIRGWEVKTSDGRTVGKVEELIVDTGAMRARYMEVNADKDAVGGAEDRYVLVPMGTARLDEEDDTVIVTRLPTGGFGGVPAYTRGRVDRAYEQALQASYGRGAASTGAAAGTGGEFHELYDDRHFWGGRRRGREDAAYLTRSEEELAVGTHPRRAGEVDVKKRVETEHVKKRVPVAREEVTVERRPATSAQATPRIGKDEITVPITEEEVIVEKRAVPKEEVVIRKEVHRDEKTVEADLRKERIEVDRKGNVDVRRR
ncbi:MAG TPA: DUF2382 domain-containing protein [Gemmatimonadaceae bacterium]